MKFLATGKDLEYADNLRFMSISTQTRELLLRSRLVRNAILSMQGAIAFFVLTSVGIGVNLFVTTGFLQVLPLGIFVLGMLLVFVGVLFAAREVHRSFKSVLLEVKAED